MEFIKKNHYQFWVLVPFWPPYILEIIPAIKYCKICQKENVIKYFKKKVLKYGWIINAPHLKTDNSLYDTFGSLVSFMYFQLTKNKGLCKMKHDTTAECQQVKVEQVFIKSNSEHSILLDTVNSST
jgi:hypothetical protein